MDFAIEYVIVDKTNQNNVLHNINPYKLVLNSIGSALNVAPNRELIKNNNIDCSTLNLINGLLGMGLLVLTNK